MPKTSTEERAWIAEAIRRVDADANRSADTHMHVVPIPVPGIDLYLKDESVHPTGSLKHRLARSLFMYALCNGWIGEKSTVIEASSGSTAVSEAYFARLIDLPFVAVMPASTSTEKIALIEFYGGRCHLVDDPGTVYDEARRLATECGGHYMDQFTYAERATDWRGHNNIAESIFEQLSAEPHPCPSWIVVGAGTGGTSATIGRFVRYRRFDTRVAVADPENSAFYAGWESDRSDVTTDTPSRIEGIGRMRIEPSFVGGVIDDMVQVPDAASVAAMRWISAILGRTVGPSTGTNVWASLQLIGQMRDAGEEGSVVTLLCDGGERYSHTYYDDTWLAEHELDITPYADALAEFEKTGVLPTP
ncbi:PLP-dependent cysteine synthase family protein [Aeromicrobium sp.]|uniref:PLP-dependent cysteine synthase family protein n=1 Tax=Aeromicrobium sp. TaxID=1871063 RepID=UPI002FCC97BC